MPLPPPRVVSNGQGGTRPLSWLEHLHPEYVRLVARWEYARDHYTGDVLDKLDLYLVKKGQAESPEAYLERKKLADYTNHFGSVVDSLAGMIYHVEDEANRVYANDESEGLGDPEDHDSPIGRLLGDADGTGAGLVTMMKQLAADLSVTRLYWVMVDGGADGEPRVRLLPPLSVPNWRHDPVTGALVDVIVREDADVRQAIQDQPMVEARFIHFETTGWTRYRIDPKDGSAIIVGGTADSTTYKYVNRAGHPTVPIFPVWLPLRRDVGWMLAKKANAIFNQESTRDNLLRSCNFPKLVLHANDDLFEELKTGLAKGSNVLQAAPDAATHAFIAPDSGPATIATEALKRKVEEFYISAFREYGNAAAQKTATESRQDVASGAGAYLQMLSAALDDAENGIYWYVAQTLFPNDEKRWRVASVERSHDFVPPDQALVLEGRRVRYLGKDGIIPVGRDALVSMAKEMAAYDGIAVNDEQLECAVEAYLLDQLAQDPAAPAELKVQALLKKVEAAGVIDDAQTVEMTDGDKRKLVDEIEKGARALTTAADQASIQEAQMTGMGGGQFGA